MENEIRKICKNCDDYDAVNKVCALRFVIKKDKTKTPMKRRPEQTGCEAFMYKI